MDKQNEKEFLAMLIAARQYPLQTVQSKCLLMYYAINANKHGYFYKSYIEICMDCRVAERTVRAFNEFCIKAGFLNVREPEPMSGKSTEYFLNLKRFQELAQGVEAEREKRLKKMRTQNAERQRRWREKHRTPPPPRNAQK